MINYYEEIKTELINNEVYKRVKDYSKNRNDLNTYYKVGELIVKAQGGEKRAKYGDGLIKEYSKKLTIELGKGYSTRNLKNMRKFYLFQKGQALPTLLTWSHYCELFHLNDNDEIRYYINISIKQNLSYRQLHEKIKNKEYERLDNDTKNKLIVNKKTEVNDFIKNPILIKTKKIPENISEKILQQFILEDLSNFMKELGEGFCFIDNEYKIKIGDRFYYIDLLFFNYIYNCFVVIELKVTEFKKEHISQIQTYMNYIDKNIKSINQDKTIGIIIVKKENKFIMEYVSNDRIFTRKYQLI